jgi:hypothetical protein
MEMPVILILVGVFVIIAAWQIVTLKKYLNQRKTDSKH